MARCPEDLNRSRRADWAQRSEVLELPRDDFKRLVLPNAEVKAMVNKLMNERLERSAGLDRNNANLV